MKRILLFLIPLALLGSSCDGLLDPKPTGDLTNEEELWVHAAYGEGFLGQAYENLDYGRNIFLDTYTDNAVPATQGENDLALGSWTVENNPIGDWETYYNSIKNLNIFLENAYDLTYDVTAPVVDSTRRSRRIGEAFYLRAWYQWKLLQTYGGYVQGEAMGFPIVTTVLTQEDNLDLARDSYEDCVAQIVSDLDSAMVRLPLQYSATPQNRGRGSGLAAMALKARVYLYAASPAYGDSNQQLWERAAQAAYDAIAASGGLTNLASYGNFNNEANYQYIWIQPTFTENDLEQDYYPPSFFGEGNINPSQNLVNAFPAADGYPIDQSTLYDADNPYYNRDPRFERFIFHNAEIYDAAGELGLIETFTGGADAPGGLTAEGTRTGYYMQKHLSNDVRLNPGDETEDIKFKIFLKRAGLYLDFAEAANEAYGPTNAILGISSADAMRMIRERAGIDSDPGTAGYQDQYLADQAAAGKDAFRSFIHNERRLELCFEGHRFWDLRRWNEPLDHTVRGVSITVAEASGSEQRPERNVALESAPSTDYVSPWESLSAINDGAQPSSSQDPDNYGNWNSAGQWRWVQYDFPTYLTLDESSNEFRVDSMAVYWWESGDGGVIMPDSVRLEYLNDSGTWVEVPNPSGYGTAADQWNITTFDPVDTGSIRLNMKSNTESTGIVEWQVWGAESNFDVFTYEEQVVEEHTYQDYMRYVPVPYGETLILENLEQNSGW